MRSCERFLRVVQRNAAAGRGYDRGMRIAIVLALTACATPYQRMGLSGGYDDKRLGNGDYVVTVKVNGFTDRATALEYLHRRAGELCPDGYKLVDRTDGDNGDFRTGSKPELDAVVRCKDTAREAAVEARRHEEANREHRKEAAIAVPRGFFCTSAAAVNLCVRDKAECARARESMLGAVPDLAACAIVESAWCTGDRCATTADGCEAIRARLAGTDGAAKDCVEVK